MSGLDDNCNPQFLWCSSPSLALLIASDTIHSELSMFLNILSTHDRSKKEFLLLCLNTSWVNS
ncbi:hypothetical protein ACU8KH_03443 [Lachancea thermotolerans]